MEVRKRTIWMCAIHEIEEMAGCIIACSVYRLKQIDGLLFSY